MPVDSDQSARDALTQAMVTVRRINQLSAQAQAQAMMGAGAPMDDIPVTVNFESSGGQ